MDACHREESQAAARWSIDSSVRESVEINVMSGGPSEINIALKQDDSEPPAEVPRCTPCLTTNTAVSLTLSLLHCLMCLGSYTSKHAAGFGRSCQPLRAGHNARRYF